MIDRARDAGVPVLVYASASGVPERVEDYLFPVYRYVRRRLRGGGAATTRQTPDSSPSADVTGEGGG